MAHGRTLTEHDSLHEHEQNGGELLSCPLSVDALENGQSHNKEGATAAKRQSPGNRVNQQNTSALHGSWTESAWEDRASSLAPTCWTNTTRSKQLRYQKITLTSHMTFFNRSHSPAAGSGTEPSSQLAPWSTTPWRLQSCAESIPWPQSVNATHQRHEQTYYDDPKSAATSIPSFSCLLFLARTSLPSHHAISGAVLQLRNPDCTLFLAATILHTTKITPPTTWPPRDTESVDSQT